MSKIKSGQEKGKKVLSPPDFDKIKALIDCGYELIPLHQAGTIGPDNKPWGKRPLESGWLKRPALTEQEVRDLMTEGHNVGVRLREIDLIVDIDPRNFALDGETDNRGVVLSSRPDLKLAKDFGFSLDDYPTVITGSYFPNKDPSTGLHIYMRVKLPEDWVPGKSRLRKDLHGFKGIDFKTVGGQVVAPGSVHPDTGRYYEFDDLTYPELQFIKEAPPGLIEALHVKGGLGASLNAEEADITPEQLQAVLDQITVEDFRDQHKWQEFMMACHAATQGLGFNEFVAWSTSDPLYAHSGSDIAYRWESLNANSQGGITFRTLEKMAREHGVEQMPMNGHEFDEVAEEDAEFAKAPKPKEKHPLQELNERFFAVMEAGKFKIYQEEYDLALDRIYIEKYDYKQFAMMLADKKIQKGDNPVPLAKAWLEWPGRNFYDGVQFLPEYGDEQIISSQRGTRKIFNLWRGFSVNASDKAQCPPLLGRLIREALAGGDETVERYILNWLAYAVQVPHKPAEVAVVFRGAKGTGKSTLGRIFSRLFGQHGMQITSSTLLTGRFNGHLRDTVALFADEAFYAGNKQDESVLKGLITESHLAFEGKGVDARMGRNCVHVMMASNNEWVVPAGLHGERRFAVFDVSQIFRGDVAFFDALNAEIEDPENLGRFLQFLKKRGLGRWHPRLEIPKTKAFREQVEIGLTPLQQFIKEALDAGDAGVWEPMVDGWPDGKGVVVPVETFIGAFKTYMRGTGNRLYAHDVSVNAIGRALSGLFEESSFRKRKLSSRPPGYEHLTSARPYVYEFPPLPECREAWDAHSGLSGDWDDV